ncbi:hypothetical protein [Candidatus Uabimicrobium sp. HlEnr_7]|uniref:hypothetical protein n=1 Tax=Candidatus Uabimicrobium helgolandensis TaxID=3095367 RepID=UPI0035584A94
MDKASRLYCPGCKKRFKLTKAKLIRHCYLCGKDFPLLKEKSPISQESAKQENDKIIANNYKYENQYQQIRKLIFIITTTFFLLGLLFLYFSTSFAFRLTGIFIIMLSGFYLVISRLLVSNVHPDDVLHVVRKYLYPRFVPKNKNESHRDKR